MSEFYKNVYGADKLRKPDPVNDQLRVFQFPMQTDTNNPKLPDGKATLSVGIKLQQTTELQLTEGIAHFYMFPGLSNGFMFDGAAHTDPDVPEHNLPYSVHGKVLTNNTYEKQVTVTGEQEWRIVSQQVKLTSINSANDYDGWWECIRMPTIPRDVDFWVKSKAGAGDAETYDVLPGYDIEAGTNAAIPYNQDMSNNTTYCSGKIKDLHRFNFQLLPSANDHDFIDLNANSNELKLTETLVDRSYDCWYMRVHGTPVSESSEIVRPTTIMVHIVSNQEVMYRDTVYHTRFHNECYDASSKLKTIARKMHLNTKAAKPMYGGGV